MTGVWGRRRMSKSPEAGAVKQLATQFCQVRELEIYTVYTAMDIHVYGSEQVSTTKYWEFVVHQNSCRHGVTK